MFDGVTKITGKMLHRFIDLNYSWNSKIKGPSKKIIERQTRRKLGVALKKIIKTQKFFERSGETENHDRER